MDVEFNSSAVYISPLNIAIHGIVFKRKKNRVSWLSFIEKNKAYLGNMKAAKTIFIFTEVFSFFLASLFNVYYFHQSVWLTLGIQIPWPWVPREMVKFNPELSQILNNVFLSKDM